MRYIRRVSDTKIEIQQLLQEIGMILSKNKDRKREEERGR